MAEKSDEEKNLDPSEQRRQEFRDQGKVAKSQEITGAVGLLAGFGSLLVAASMMSSELQALTSSCWQWTEVSMREPFMAGEGFTRTTNALLAILAFPLGVMWATSLVVGLLQSRFIIPKEPIKFDLNRINPIENGRQKFFTSQPLVELAKGVGKIVLIGGVVWVAARQRVLEMPAMSYASVHNLPEQMWDVALMVLLRALPVAIIIAILDYAYQSWRLFEEMKMSRQELKEEQRRAEGDPHFKAARRQRQLEIARKAAAVKAVPKADVIITNPTHYAIALRYRGNELPAPVVLARGVDHLALKMQAVARQHDVPRVENRLLARALYAQCKEGEMIPEELYGAVAEILAVIYRRRANRPK